MDKKVYLQVTDISHSLQACDIEEDGLISFDLHSDGDGNRLLLQFRVVSTHWQYFFHNSPPKQAPECCSPRKRNRS